MFIAEAIPVQNVIGSYSSQSKSSLIKENNSLLINGISYTISTDQLYSVEQISPSSYRIDTRDFLQNMELHTDYPSVSEKAKLFANLICKIIFDFNKLTPSRIANSVEGGIAIVYSQKKGVFTKQYKELFIECYNDNTAVISFTENYKLKKIDEVTFEDTKIVSTYVAEIFNTKNS